MDSQPYQFDQPDPEAILMKTQTPIKPQPTELNKIASVNRKHLEEAGVLMVRLAGPPGAGKTSLVTTTARHLAGRKRVGVIVVNPAATRDATLLRSVCDQVAAIESPIPEATDVRTALKGFKLADLDIILLEACGGIVRYPDVGEDLTAAMFPVSGGDDKAAEYRNLVERAALIVIGKTDLRRYVRFDLDAFRHEVQKINPASELIELSMGDDAGLSAWLRWLKERADEKQAGRTDRLAVDADPEWFFG